VTFKLNGLIFPGYIPVSQIKVRLLYRTLQRTSCEELI
jgi:hypothetical protein